MVDSIDKEFVNVNFPLFQSKTNRNKSINIYINNKHENYDAKNKKLLFPQVYDNRKRKSSGNAITKAEKLSHKLLFILFMTAT